ncbi:MAG: DUF4296 domain-containing protein [Flavobacteriaceae bacterium]|nr:DUF4296 domain-containing protein [Flavobacteriaceae bacterium]
MKYFILIFLVFLLGCEEEEKPQRPSNLLAKGEMVDILYDVYILNAAKGINKKLLEFNGVQPETYIYEKYKIDSLQFAQSNTYYSYWPDTYEAIIDSVRQRVAKLKDIYEDERDQEELEKKRKRDSINTIIKEGRDSLYLPKTKLRRYKDSLMRYQRYPDNQLDSISQSSLLNEK